MITGFICRQEGAFDSAVVGVDGIVHVATPLPNATESPDGTSALASAQILYFLLFADGALLCAEIVRTSKEVSLSVLKSALNNG